MPKSDRRLFRAAPVEGVEGVDREKRTIYGASMISVGDLLGHSLSADDTTIGQVVEHANKVSRGVKVRFGHPMMSVNAEGTFLGRAKNWRVDGDRARADVELNDVAFREDSPSGNIGDYVLDLAESDPDAFGTSIVVDGDEEYEIDEDGNKVVDENGKTKNPMLRIKRLWAADIVDEPATGDGMFSKTVVLSSVATEQLDKLIDEPTALDTIRSFLGRYVSYRGDKHNNLGRLLSALDMATDNGVTEKDEKENFSQTEKGYCMPNDVQRSDDSELRAALEREKNEAVESAKKTERERVEFIRALGTRVGASAEKINEMVENGTSVADAGKVFSRQEVETAVPVAPEKPEIKFGVDARDKFVEGAGASLAMQAGVLDQEKDAKTIDNVRRSQYNGIGIMQLARNCLHADGVGNAHIMNNEDVYSLMMRRLRVQLDAGGSAQATGDFANLLSNTLNKALARGWEVAGTTYQKWCGTGSLRDFKQADLIKVTEFSDVVKIPEGQAAKYGEFSDTKETAQLETYGRLYSLTRQAMINDDLNWFARVPMRVTAAVRRKMNKLAYGLIYNNNGGTSDFVGPTMNEDSNSLFDATNHSNYVAAASGGAPSTSTLNTAWIAMRTQTLPSPDGGRSDTIYANIQPKYILFGPNQAMNVYRLLSSTYLVGSNEVGNAEGSMASNIYGPGQVRNMIPIEDAEIDGLNSSYNPWYLAADPSLVGTVTVYTLNGKDAPTSKSEEARISEVQGMSWSVMHDFTFAVEDWRGLYCNVGS